LEADEIEEPQVVWAGLFQLSNVRANQAWALSASLAERLAGSSNFPQHTPQGDSLEFGQLRNHCLAPA